MSGRRGQLLRCNRLEDVSMSWQKMVAPENGRHHRQRCKRSPCLHLGSSIPTRRILRVHDAPARLKEIPHGGVPCHRILIR